MNYSSCDISLWLVPGNFLLRTGSVWKKKQAAGSFFFFLILSFTRAIPTVEVR